MQPPTRRLNSMGGLPLFLSIFWLAVLGGAVIVTEPPIGTVSGRVVAKAGGAPLQGARVVIDGPVRRLGWTREDGTYRVDRVPAGNYRVEAMRRGYDSQWQQSATAVEEGRIAAGVDFALLAREPELHLGQPQRVFLPGEKVRVASRGVLFQAFELELHRVRLTDYLKVAGSWDAFDESLQSPGKFAFKGPAELVARWTNKVPELAVNDEDGWFHQQIEVPASKPGAYVLRARGVSENGKPGAAMMWFTVSRTGLVAKHGPDGMLVYAADLVANRPRPGVAVRVLGKNGQLAAGVTDGQGLWRTAATEPGSWLVLGQDGDSPAVVNSWFDANRDRHAVYAYTERPVYRPAQTVYFKGVVRRKDGNSWQVPKGVKARVEIVDSRDETVFSGAVPVGASGSYHGEYALASAAHLGDYTLRTTLTDPALAPPSNTEAHNTTFKVQEYRKPEYKLEIASDRKQVIQGQPIRATVRASYYFGAPAAGVKTHYTVYSAPYYGAGGNDEEDFYFGFRGDDYPEYWGLGDVVSEGDAVADAQGIVGLNIPTRRDKPGEESGEGKHQPTYDQVYTIEVEATDISRRPVTERHRVLVSQGGFRIETSTSKRLYAPGEQVQLAMRAVDYDGKPVPDAVVTLVISREEQIKGKTEEDPYTYRYFRFLTVSVKTDAKGRAVWTGPAPGEGYLNFQARATDQWANTITSEQWTWVSGDTFAWQGEQPLELVFDKQVYKPGDTARVLIASPVEGATALITVEGPRVYYAQTIHLATHARLVPLPVRAEYAPNVHVNVAISHGKRFFQRSRSLNVSPKAHFLNLAVAADRAQYGPGQPVKYEVKATDGQGKPVAGAEVSLGVVDAAVYAIAPEETPDIRRFFWGPRYNDVNTSYSFAEEYSGGADKEQGQRVRRNFKDTAGWFPALVTGKDGVARATVTLPDNLTTWVATARGVTADTAVGAGARSVLSTKDLLVRLVTPRFFVQNDRMSLSTIVHNNTKQEQPVTVQVRAPGMRLEMPAPWKTAVPAGGMQGHDWTVTVMEPGEHEISAHAAAGPRLGDALALMLPVLPHGIPTYIPFADAAPDNGESRFRFTLPTTSLPATWRFQINLSPTPAAGMVGALPYLSNFPYGCVEQTMDAFLPSAVALHALAQLGLSRPKLEAELPAQIRQGLAKLADYQHGDGGWGWWKHDDSQPFVSAYVLYGLSLAQQARVPVDPGPIKEARRFLRRAVRDLDKDVFFRYWVDRGAGPDTRAYILHALSYQGAAETAELDRLWLVRDKLSSYSLALLALTMANAGRTDDAHAALRALGERAKATAGERVHWESQSLPYSWLDSDVEATAYALKAYLRLAPQDPRVDGAARWLLGQRKGDRWNSTKDSAAAVMALADYLQARVVTQAPAYTTRVYINNQEVGSFPVDRGNMFDPDRTVLLKGRPLIAGENAVRVVKDGYGPLQHAAALSYTDLREDIPAEAGHGLKITREYFLLSPALRARKGDYAFSDFYKPEVLKKLQPVGPQVRSGEVVLAHLQIEADDKYQYVILEDPLPAGAEVQEEPADEWRYWWSHREVHDDRVAFFFTRLEKGVQHVYYILRPMLPGEYHVLPTTAYGMYTPEIRGNSAENRLAITP